MITDKQLQRFKELVEKEAAKTITEDEVEELKKLRSLIGYSDPYKDYTFEDMLVLFD